MRMLSLAQWGKKVSQLANSYGFNSKNNMYHLVASLEYKEYSHLNGPTYEYHLHIMTTQTSSHLFSGSNWRDVLRRTDGSFRMKGHKKIRNRKIITDGEAITG